MNELHLVGSKEAARLLGISRSNLQRLVAAGTIAPVARGEGARGAMVFATAELERWASTRRADSTAAEAAV